MKKLSNLSKQINKAVKNSGKKARIKNSCFHFYSTAQRGHTSNTGISEMTHQQGEIFKNQKLFGVHIIQITASQEQHKQLTLLLLINIAPQSPAQLIW